MDPAGHGSQLSIFVTIDKKYVVEQLLNQYLQKYTLLIFDE